MDTPEILALAQTGAHRAVHAPDEIGRLLIVLSDGGTGYIDSELTLPPGVALQVLLTAANAATFEARRDALLASVSLALLTCGHVVDLAPDGGEGTCPCVALPRDEDDG